MKSQKKDRKDVADSKIRQRRGLILAPGWRGKAGFNEAGVAHLNERDRRAKAVATGSSFTDDAVTMPGE